MGASVEARALRSAQQRGALHRSMQLKMRNFRALIDHRIQRATLIWSRPSTGDREIVYDLRNSRKKKILSMSQGSQRHCGLSMNINE